MTDDTRQTPGCGVESRRLDIPFRYQLQHDHPSPGPTHADQARAPLVLPDSALTDRSKVRVAAAFIGYRRAVRDVTFRRRAASADFKLTASAVELEEALATNGMESPMASPMPDKDESITNTQHAGVDEGGMVKLHGDHLVVLRRGRLFTVSVRAGELRPVATVDAYPHGAEPAEWYDEMLVEGDRVIVIGYSYQRGGTEVSLFAIDDRGGLRHLSTSHLPVQRLLLLAQLLRSAGGREAGVLYPALARLRRPAGLAPGDAGVAARQG